jgi:hypothetical protein
MLDVWFAFGSAKGNPWRLFLQPPAPIEGPVTVTGPAPGKDGLAVRRRRGFIRGSEQPRPGEQSRQSASLRRYLRLAHF